MKPTYGAKGGVTSMSVKRSQYIGFAGRNGYSVCCLQQKSRGNHLKEGTNSSSVFPGVKNKLRGCTNVLPWKSVVLHTNARIARNYWQRMIPKSEEFVMGVMLIHRRQYSTGNKSIIPSSSKG